MAKAVGAWRVILEQARHALRQVATVSMPRLRDLAQRAVSGAAAVGRSLRVHAGPTALRLLIRLGAAFAAISRWLSSGWQRLKMLGTSAAQSLRRRLLESSPERPRPEMRPEPRLELPPERPQPELPIVDRAAFRLTRSWLIALRVLLVLAVLSAAGAAAAWAGWQHMLTAPADDGAEPQVFVVNPGQATGQIAANLEAAGLIRNAHVFRLWVRISGDGGRLQAGEYRLAADMDVAQITDKFVRGQIILYPVTIPEGYNIAQIQELLVAKGLVDPDRFRQALIDIEASGTLPAEHLPARQHLLREPLEGYLFPDTYNFRRGVTEIEIVQAMVNRFKSAYNSELIARGQEIGMSVAETLTLASIIEKEARVADERPLMSGVFHNRMRVGMRLEACPTVRYVMPNPNAPITPREWAIDSPYNTYVYGGLPPGPICSPGIASIVAALNPVETHYFFFVARPDGSHAFARTFAEHNANVRRYIR